MNTQIYVGTTRWQNLVKNWFRRSPEWIREKLPPPRPEDEFVDWDNVLAREIPDEDDATA